jgi:predicted DNA-binding transcriptional regulator YafY
MTRELQRYLASNQLVEMIYIDRNGMASKRTVRLITITGGRVKAYCYTRHANRIFTIENILAIAPIRSGKAV